MQDVAGVGSRGRQKYKLGGNLPIVMKRRSLEQAVWWELGYYKTNRDLFHWFTKTCVYGIGVRMFTDPSSPTFSGTVR